MQTNEKLLYKGFTIKCPLCGRNHGLILKSSKVHDPHHSEDDEVWVKCPTCNLTFEGAAIARWNRTQAFKELSETAIKTSNSIKNFITSTKTTYTIYLLDEIECSVTKCFRTPMYKDELYNLLTQLKKTCKPGQHYIYIEEVD